jgi:hypothetical protein
MRLTHFLCWLHAGRPGFLRASPHARPQQFQSHAAEIAAADPVWTGGVESFVRKRLDDVATQNFNT